VRKKAHAIVTGAACRKWLLRISCEAGAVVNKTRKGISKEVSKKCQKRETRDGIALELPTG